MLHKARAINQFPPPSSSVRAGWASSRRRVSTTRCLTRRMPSNGARERRGPSPGASKTQHSFRTRPRLGISTSVQSPAEISSIRARSSRLDIYGYIPRRDTGRCISTGTRRGRSPRSRYLPSQCRARVIYKATSFVARARRTRFAETRGRVLAADAP